MTRIKKNCNQSEDEVDTRIKFHFFGDEREEEIICVSTTRVHIGNQTYLIDDKFRQMIQKLVYD